MSAVVHAAWRDDRSRCSFLQFQRTTYLHREVTCLECRELVAAEVAGLCGLSVDDVKAATWPETSSPSGGPRSSWGPPAPRDARTAGDHLAPRSTPATVPDVPPTSLASCVGLREEPPGDSNLASDSEPCAAITPLPREAQEGGNSPNRTPSSGQQVAGVDGSTDEHRRLTTSGAVTDPSHGMSMLGGQRGSWEGGPPTSPAAANSSEARP